MGNPISILTELGITKLEAKVYTYLVQHSPATGYKVAQGIKKPVANVYKIIESLRMKGAILVEQGPTQMLRAVPPDEFLGMLKRTLVERCEQAQHALAELPVPPEDDRIYHLTSYHQVFERARALIQGCKRILLMDIGLKPLEALRSEIEAAAARGVEVTIRAHGNAVVRGADVICALQLEDNGLKSWPGYWLNLVVDGAEHLLAFLSRDGEEVHHAIWSSSAYLSWVYFSGVSSEIFLDVLIQKIYQGAASKELTATVNRYLRLWPSDAPGRQMLMDRFDCGKDEQPIQNTRACDKRQPVARREI